MPRVPTRETASVGVTGAPIPYQSSQAATPEAFGAGAARALGGVGEAVGQFGNVMEKHALLMQQRANESYGKDLFLGADVEMGQATVEYSSLEGINKVNAYPDYVKKLEGIREKWKGQAPNVEVAHHFDNDFTRRMALTINNGAGQAATANKQYNQQNSAAMVKNAQSDTAANADDDVRFMDNLQLTFKNTFAAAKESGDGPDETKRKMVVAGSELWQTRLHSIAQTEPFRAEKLLEANKGDIDGTVALKIQENINNQKVNVGTRIVTDAITNGTPSPNLPKMEGPYGPEQHGDIKGKANVAKADSTWGNPNAPGFVENHLTTIKTASGKELSVNRVAAPYFQGFINDLEASGYKVNDAGGYNYRANKSDPRMLSQHAYGNAIDINPDQNPFTRGAASPKTNMPADISAMAAKWGLSWGGDWSNVKDAMHFEFAGVEAKGKPIQVADASGNTVSGKKLGPLTPDSGPDWLDAAHDRAKEEARRLAPNDPRFEDQLLTRVDTEYNRVKHMKTQADNLNFLTVQGAVMGDFADKMMKSPEQIYSNPTLNTAFGNLSVPKQLAVLNQIKKNATADVPLTPERYARFQEIMGKRITDPQGFMETVPGEADIPRTLQSQIFNAQRAIQGKLQDTTKINAALRTVGPMLADADIGPSHTDQTKASTYNQFVGAFDVKLKAWETEKKRFPNEAEQREIAAGLLTETEHNWFFSNRREFELPPSWTGSDGKSFSADEWKGKFRERYGRDPTPDQLFTIYQRSLNRGR